MASCTPTEVIFMIWGHLLAIKLEEEPRIYQLKGTRDPDTGTRKMTVYGDKTQPALPHIKREARRIGPGALRPHPRPPACLQ